MKKDFAQHIFILLFKHSVHHWFRQPTQYDWGPASKNEKNGIAEEGAPHAQIFSIKSFPNPTSNYFVIVVSNSNNINDAISLQVADMIGKSDRN